ncbi:uncharacterized protein LOC126899995 [Daktulosphaira vitifoliae]|uniref:uncharacterized protein LOC126899995 n=1 Tax=Daktulosphaira vitifoliae TaxID=58002 RepID=UPI0021AAF51B|nr:uncharacterized protein LOC126899995 [Daktulosphaira vitifoliae]
MVHVPSFLVLSLIVMVSYVNSTIFVPEEIPSLLSLVYSNIPPIKKGTDSRFGVGFRLGPNADVQFQVELGPQTHTRPIGPSSETPDTTSKKRHVVASNKPVDWLNKWRLQMNPGYTDDVHNEDIVEDNSPMSLQSESVNSDTLAHLRQLYTMGQVKTR